MMDIGRREQMEESEDAAPLEMLAQLFEARGWPCEFVNEDEICGEIQGSWATYQIRGVWRTEDQVLQLLCLPEIRVPEAKRKAAYELLALVNEQLWLGHFDIWSNGGVLLYRHGLMLGSEGMLSLSMAQLAVGKRGRRVRPVLSGVPVRAVGRQETARRARRSAGRRRG
jgi:hypothetical protein